MSEAVSTGTGAAETANVVTQTTGTGTGTTEPTGNGKPAPVTPPGQETQPTPEDIARRIQSAEDRVRNEYGKRVKALEDELDAEKRAHMTAEQAAEADREKRERELADRESRITDKENRYFALQAVTGLNYPVSGDQANAIVDLVMAPNQKEITARVTALKGIIDALVKQQVESTFRANGTTPKGGTKGGAEEDDAAAQTAKQLGQRVAERNKRSADILTQYKS